MNNKNKIMIAGASGMVGSALERCLTKKRFENVLTPSHKELDLLDQSKILNYFDIHQPDYIFLCAGKVGGIFANNKYRADFIYNNLQIQLNVINAANEVGIKKLMHFGSSCIYPKFCDQPIKEEYLLTGSLEYSNEPYAISKIAGVKLCEAFNSQHNCNYISVMPTNLYGPNDNYNLESSHVMAALIRKTHEAKYSNSKDLIIWGTGDPRREFLHVNDLAEACIFLMENNIKEQLINIGSGEDITIKELAQKIVKILNYDGNIFFDKDKPDGTPRKLLDVSKIHNLGWHHKIDLEAGINQAYKSSPFYK
jgi:GDP-L-fucose synthase